MASATSGMRSQERDEIKCLLAELGRLHLFRVLMFPWPSIPFRRSLAGWRKQHRPRSQADKREQGGTACLQQGIRPAIACLEAPGRVSEASRLWAANEFPLTEGGDAAEEPEGEVAKIKGDAKDPYHDHSSNYGEQEDPPVVPQSLLRTSRP